MTPPSDDQMRLLNAALDGELDAAGMMRVEGMIADDPRLASQYRRLQQLQQALRTRLPRESAPEPLKARIAALATAPASPSKLISPARRPRAYRPFAALAASLIIGVFIGAGAMQSLTPATTDAEGALLAGYIRGRLSGQPVDVVSSDRHTVKPWLAGKVADATTVPDLKAQGFPLIGGRIDIMGTHPAPTLVYQRREHQIALTEAPAEGAAQAPRLSSRDGYTFVEWLDSGRRYLAVSDLPPAEMTQFAEAFRHAVAAERETTP